MVSGLTWAGACSEPSAPTATGSESFDGFAGESVVGAAPAGLLFSSGRLASGSGYKAGQRNTRTRLELAQSSGDAILACGLDDLSETYVQGRRGIPFCLKVGPGGDITKTPLGQRAADAILDLQGGDEERVLIRLAGQQGFSIVNIAQDGGQATGMEVPGDLRAGVLLTGGGVTVLQAQMNCEWRTYNRQGVSVVSEQSAARDRDCATARYRVLRDAEANRIFVLVYRHEGDALLEVDPDTGAVRQLAEHIGLHPEGIAPTLVTVRDGIIYFDAGEADAGPRLGTYDIAAKVRQVRSLPGLKTGDGVQPTLVGIVGSENGDGVMVTSRGLAWKTIEFKQ